MENATQIYIIKYIEYVQIHQTITNFREKGTVMYENAYIQALTIELSRRRYPETSTLTQLHKAGNKAELTQSAMCEVAVAFVKI